MRQEISCNLLFRVIKSRNSITTLILSKNLVPMTTQRRIYLAINVGNILENWGSTKCELDGLAFIDFSPSLNVLLNVPYVQSARVARANQNIFSTDLVLLKFLLQRDSLCVVCLLHI